MNVDIQYITKKIFNNKHEDHTSSKWFEVVL